MATISSAGLGSGLDVETIVTKLVALERAPINQLQTEKSRLQADLSSYGKLQSQLSTLRDAARTLTDTTGWSPVTAASSDAATVAVSAGSSAVPSSYEMTVARMASAQQLASVAFSSAAATVGQGTITIDIGSWNGDQSAFIPKVPASTASIVIGPGDDTLEKIRDKINGAAVGVTASIVRDVHGARLTLRSTQTGAENAFRIGVTEDGAAGLSALAYDPSVGDEQMSRNQQAANAQVTINGLAVESASNTLSDVMDGLTLTLGKPSATPVTVTVNRDTEAVKKNITDFATAYNETVKFLREQTKYDAGSKAAGTLQGDRTAAMLQNQLRAIMGATTGASSVLKRLTDIGLDPQSDGTLKVNATKLTSGVAKLDELKKMFSGTDGAVSANNGFAVQMRRFTDLVLGDGGALTSRQEALRASITRNDSRQTQLADRVDAFEKRVRAQYSALDTRMGQLSGLSSYITQQIAQFNKN
ncbi:flagellar capping protein [Burkholderiales bacterium JOSHI_001]|nr:flagellar capping protein [Burkholderiales bacterium JOSHI_001]